MNTNVQTVHNGIDLMKHLNENVSPTPHLLFLDLNMPKKSGLECLKEIRELEQYKNLTIVIYSTSSSSTDIENTFLYGANVYINKPIQLELLRKALAHVLKINWQYHTSSLNRDNFLLQL